MRFRPLLTALGLNAVPAFGWFVGDWSAGTSLLDLRQDLGNAPFRFDPILQFCPICLFYRQHLHLACGQISDALGGI